MKTIKILIAFLPLVAFSRDHLCFDQPKNCTVPDLKCYDDKDSRSCGHAGYYCEWSAGCLSGQKDSPICTMECQGLSPAQCDKKPNCHWGGVCSQRSDTEILGKDCRAYCVEKYGKEACDHAIFAVPGKTCSGLGIEPLNPIIEECPCAYKQSRSSGGEGK